MERKFKIISLYIGLLFFVVILLILVTSFSNTELNPSYDVESEQTEYQVTFNRTMQESVNSLTENNEKLNEQVKILTDELKEKEKIISQLESQDRLNLADALNLYLQGDTDTAREKFDLILSENLNEKDIELYNQLGLNLK